MTPITDENTFCLNVKSRDFNAYSKRLNCAHVTMGFLQRACWLVRYSVIIESNVTDRLGVTTPGPPPPPGSLKICFCKDLQLVGCS